MTRLTLLAAGAALAFATGASAQQQPPAQPPAATMPAPAAPEAPAAGPSIKSVTILDIEELPEATKTQVDAIVAQSSEAELATLRNSIDTMPEIKSALEAKGLTSANVIAANMTQDGALTLVTRKAS
jgi:hypothetical protein